jgi:O-antigen/teichoic acid export membrane protein
MTEPFPITDIKPLTTSRVRSSKQDGMTTRVARGTLWTLGGQCALILAAVITTPFIIRRLGSEAYGILTLMNVLIGYLAISDMGMGLTATRFSAGPHSRFDDQGEAVVVWTSALIALVPATITGLTFAFLADPIVNELLRLPAEFRSESVVVIRLAAVGFVARTASSVLSAPQLVRLRMDLNALVTSGMAIVQNCLILAVLVFGGGLVAAVSIIACD